MRTLEMLVVSTHDLGITPENWTITKVNDWETAVEKIQGIDFDLIAIEENIDNAAAIKALAKFQQEETSVINFSNSNDIEKEIARIEAELKEDRTYSFTDNAFANLPIYNL